METALLSDDNELFQSIDIKNVRDLGEQTTNGLEILEKKVEIL